MLLTLTRTSLRHTFSIRTGAGLPIPQKRGSGGGHGSLKHLLVTNGYSGIGPQRPDERTGVCEESDVRSFPTQQTRAGVLYAKD